MNIRLLECAPRTCCNCGGDAGYAIDLDAGGSSYICKPCIKELVFTVLNTVNLSAIRDPHPIGLR